MEEASATTAPGAEPGRLRAVFAFPFRIFFLSVAFLAVTAIPLWIGFLLGGLHLPTRFPILLWHRHEMIFGLLEAAIAGFLLTAVCNWTQTERMHGARLAGLWLVWAAARVLATFGAGVDEHVFLAVDLSFLPLVMLDAGLRIWGARQLRQLIVLACLGALWAMHVGSHLAPAGPFVDGALVVAMTLMLVIGGRVTPMFSGNWLRLQGQDAGVIRVQPSLEKLLIATLACLLVAVLAEAPGFLRAALALGASGASAIRLVLWQGWRVRREPLLWILHAALAWVPLALLLMAGNAAGCVPPTAWIHAVGVGAMASLILGIMSRVSLGHTGRVLVLPPGMSFAFVSILAAGVVRVATALGLVPWTNGIVAAALLWTMAFGLFAIRYVNVLTRPRLDGKPG